MTLLSVGSWFFEVMAFYLTLIGLGVDGGVRHAAEGGVHPAHRHAGRGDRRLRARRARRRRGRAHGALRSSCSISSKGAATVGTVIIRIATLWFGVVVGLIAFAVLTRKLARAGKQLDMGGDEPAADPDRAVTDLEPPALGPASPNSS